LTEQNQQMADRLNPQALQRMLADTIQAYETAKEAHARAWERIDDERTQALSKLESEDQARQAELSQVQQTERAVTEAEQTDLLPMLESVQTLENEARTLLEASGLSNLTPVVPMLTGAVNATAIELASDPSRTSQVQQEQATTTFRTVYSEYGEVLTTVCQLGRFYVENQQWDMARQTVQPLLGDAGSVFYDRAKEVYCESYYQQAQDALDLNQWVAARQNFQHILEVDTSYRDAAILIQDTYGLQRLRRWWRQRFGRYDLRSLPRL